MRITRHCPGPLTKVGVPGSTRYVAAAAERYFVARLRAHYRGLGYECFAEYEYAGGTTSKKGAHGLRHRHPAMDRVLRLLGAEINRTKKPDFLAFKEFHG